MGHMGIIQLLGQITPRICQFTRCLDLKWLQNRIFEKKNQFEAVLIVNPNALNRFLNLEIIDVHLRVILHEYS